MVMMKNVYLKFREVLGLEQKIQFNLLGTFGKKILKEH